MNNKELLEGKIVKTLMFLAFPIMGTSFLQMTYSMVDMIWIGKLGSDAVASVGTAGFYPWLGIALVTLVRVGTEVNISQSLGRKDTSSSNIFASNAIIFGLILATLYGLFSIVFRNSLIGFFNLGKEVVIKDAVDYLLVVSLGTIFAFLNPIISCIYNGSGDSKTPFLINSVGLIANIILDPFFIFGLNLGVIGAAIATVISQIIVTVILVIAIKSDRKPFENFKLKMIWNIDAIKKISKIGLPVASQSALFSIFAIMLGRGIASFGSDAIAAQKVGIQVESISYMTAHGFSTALSTFTGQNFGAKKYDRVINGIKAAGLIMTGFGIFTSLILFIFAKEIFTIFISSGPAVDMGIMYIKILALSQLFMCLEITLAGGFNGIGKTMPPAVMSIIFTGLRVPVAYFISSPTLLGLNGYWWAITLSSVVKGTLAIFMISVVIKGLRAMPIQKINNNYLQQEAKTL